jgi:hypothetical protein
LLSCIASGATGLWPFYFQGAWNEIEVRLATMAVMDDLMLIEEAWGDHSTAVPLSIAVEGGGTIDAVARWVQPPRQVGRLYVVATNRTGRNVQATVTVQLPGQAERVFCLREDRAIPVANGVWKDQFAPLDARIYTSRDGLPRPSSLGEIAHAITTAQAEREPGNLLRDGRTAWSLGSAGRNAQIWRNSLADGAIDAGGWIPWGLKPDAGGREMIIAFPKPTSVGRAVWYSSNIRGAVLEAFAFGKWTAVAEWKDRTEFRSEWSGAAVQSVKLRLRVTATAKLPGGGEDMPTVTELELYAP